MDADVLQRGEGFREDLLSLMAKYNMSVGFVAGFTEVPGKGTMLMSVCCKGPDIDAEDIRAMLFEAAHENFYSYITEYNKPVQEHRALFYSRPGADEMPH